MTEEQQVEQLEQKVEELTEELGTHTVVTKTPIHDFSWFVKWGAALIGIIGAMFTAADITPWNIVLGFISMVGWAHGGVLYRVFLAGAFMQSLVPVLKAALGG